MSTEPHASSSQCSVQPIRVGVVGLGRIGMIHALHIHELANESDLCRLTCVATTDRHAADSFVSMTGTSTPVFDSIDELLESRLSDVAIIATNTELHRAHTLLMAEAGHRVFLEKPLTGTLEGDRDLAALLEREYPQAVMLGFQRRFDAPLRFAKQLIDDGAIGRIFKIYSALEDSRPAPNGFVSPGILPDMGIHNIDEIMWLSGRKPISALAIGSNIYSHSHTTGREDFDDAMTLMDFGNEFIGQIQVGRNHVSGYRCETVIYGEQGHIHVGRFNQKRSEVIVEAYGAREASSPIASKVFEMRRYDQPLPEFIDRFGAAYKEEMRVFLECCRRDESFPINHCDGLRAQEVVAGAMRAVISPNDVGRIDYLPLIQGL